MCLCVCLHLLLLLLLLFFFVCQLLDLVRCDDVKYGKGGKSVLEKVKQAEKVLKHRGSSNSKMLLQCVCVWAQVFCTINKNW